MRKALNYILLLISLFIVQRESFAAKALQEIPNDVATQYSVTKNPILVFQPNAEKLRKYHAVFYENNEETENEVNESISTFDIFFHSEILNYLDVFSYILLDTSLHFFYLEGPFLGKLHLLFEVFII